MTTAQLKRRYSVGTYRTDRETYGSLVPRCELSALLSDRLNETDIDGVRSCSLQYRCRTVYLYN